MRDLILTILAVSAVAMPGSAQTFDNPHNPYAQQHQDHMERLRQRSDAIADYSQQYRTNARITQLELQDQRRPEPEVPLVQTAPRSPEAARASREQATAQRETVSTGVRQIDDWLNRPRD